VGGSERDAQGVVEGDIIIIVLYHYDTERQAVSHSRKTLHVAMKMVQVAAIAASIAPTVSAGSWLSVSTLGN
jgi:hypothetical protein